MNNFFDISSVVIIWASLTKGKIGNELLNNLRDFEGQKFWVNPKGWEYEGIEIFPHILDLPIITDVAVFTIPASGVIKSLIECWKKGIKRAVIISAGFKETGNKKWEEELIEVAEKYGIDVLWPNCLWYVDVNKNLNLSFGAKNIKPWNIVLISQSGAMAVALTDWAASTNIGFSKMISMGNKAVVDENSLLQQLESHRNHTKVIALYLESIQNGEAFYQVTKKLSKQVPIVLIKSWTSSRGSLAASSHTWALSSEASILDAAFSQSWVHTTDSLENFFLWSQAFSQTVDIEIPKELLIITNAGGPWVMATDHTEKNNVILTEFSDEEKRVLKRGLPETSSVANPIDIIWDATSVTYKQVLENITQLQNKRAILLILTPQSITDVENIAQVIIGFQKENPGQFIMVSFIGWVWVEKWRVVLDKAGILEYDYPKKAIITYWELLKQKEWEKEQENRLEEIQLLKSSVINNLKQKLKNEIHSPSFRMKGKGLGDGLLNCSNTLSAEILQAFQIPVLEEVLVRSVDDIDNMWYYLNDSPLIAKIVSQDIAHKSDVWWIVFDITSKKKSVEAYNAILQNTKKYFPEWSIDGVSFSKMIEGKWENQEIFVGFKRDRSFWNLLLVWAWWIYVNVYNDISRRVWLISKDEIEKMLRELTIYPILCWVRWQKGIDIDLLIDTIYKLQFVFDTFREISEIDINPVICDDTWSIIVDAKFYLNN